MEKPETGGSDPCHPVAKHLAAEVCTGTLAPFLRALGLRSLADRLCGEPPKRSARRRASGRRHSLRTVQGLVRSTSGAIRNVQQLPTDDGVLSSRQVKILTGWTE